MDLNKISDFLKALRKAKGLTQEEVANILYLSPKTISRWESGGGIPDINIISSVAELYNVSVDEILKGEKRSSSYEELSDATIKLKEKSTNKIIKSFFIRKLDKFFITSLSIEGGFLLIELLLCLLYIPLAAIIVMPIGLIVSILVYVIGNKEISIQLDEENSESYKNAYDDTKREIRRKNILFSDVIFISIIIKIVLIVVMMMV